MPEYERQSLREYLSNGERSVELENGALLAVNEKAPLALKIEELFSRQNEFDEDFQSFKLLLQLEHKELLAFQENLRTKQSYDDEKLKAEKKNDALQLELQAFMAGKKSVIDRLASKEPTNKLEKIQADIKVAEADVQNLQLICEMIVVILGYIEIDRFKKDKSNFYYNTMKKFAQSELDFNHQLQAIWREVLAHPSLALNK